MNNYFEQELLNIDREITALKTAQQKFAGEVPLVTKVIQVDVPLQLNSSQTIARGIKMVRLDSNDRCFFVATLNKYFDNIIDAAKTPRISREAYIRIGKDSNGKNLVEVIAYGTEFGDNNDVQTLVNGGSVILSYTLTVKCTDNFQMEIV